MKKIDAMHERIKNINLEIAQAKKKEIYLGLCAIPLLFLSFFVLVIPIITAMSEVLIPLAALLWSFGLICSFVIAGQADYYGSRTKELKKEKEECFETIKKMRNEIYNSKIKPIEKTKKASQVSKKKLYNGDDKSNKKNIGDEDRSS